MTEQELFSQLSDRFPLLTGGNRTAPQRHQTMIATLDWSYRLLSEGEAQLFRRLSVFRAGFTLESAQAVWGDEMAGSVLDRNGHHSLGNQAGETFTDRHTQRPNAARVEAEGRGQYQV